MTSDEKLEAIRKALGLTPETVSRHARHNLDGAFIDMDITAHADRGSLKTMERVMDQLGEVEDILAGRGGR